MKTMLDNIKEHGNRISQDGEKLFGEFSGTEPVNNPGSPFFIINPYGNRYWRDLPPEGRELQVRLLNEIKRFSELVAVVSKGLPSTAFEKITRGLESVEREVRQDQSTYWKTGDEAKDAFRKLIDNIVDELGSYYKVLSNEAIVIPDTNALLANPRIETWRFDGAPVFTVILVPTVLRELDSLKVNHRNEVVRSNSKALIRQIKEYRSRGSLAQGVPIVTNMISLKSVAREPNVKASLSWLDASNADDRFLATSLDVIRENLGRSVFIITQDINMQNKAELAGVPFCEMPSDSSKETF